MATRLCCDGCGVDITAKKFRGEDGIERCPEIGEVGDGLPRAIELRAGGHIVGLDPCPGCFDRAASALSVIFPGASIISSMPLVGSVAKS